MHSELHGLPEEAGGSSMNTDFLASELTPSEAAYGFEHRWIENEANRFGIDDDQPQIIGVIACVVSDSRLILKMNGPNGAVYEIVQYGTSHFGPEPMPTWHRVPGQSADPSGALLNALCTMRTIAPPCPHPQSYAPRIT